MRSAGQTVARGPHAVVDVLLVDDDEELLVVDDVLLFDVVVTRQEQAEETRGRELAQGPERAVGVGEGALEGFNLRSVVGVGRRDR